MNDEQKLEIALFRYGLIHSLLDTNLQKGERAAIKRNILSKMYNIPYSSRTKVAERTLDEYLQWYRERGFEGLITGKRKDAGVVKAIPDKVLEKAFEFKKEVPQRSIREIIEMLEMSGYVEKGRIKNSTLSRIMSNNQGKLRVPDSNPIKVFKRYQKERVNDFWQSDVKHCIYIPDPKNPKEYKKTYLICFLDDKSRRVSGKIYFAENTANVEDCFRKALIQMGIPGCFYTDNASYYRAKRLQTICAELGSALKYCRPYSPTSKGKLEKFNSFVNRSFEPEAGRLEIQTLYELNQYFESRLSENYNNKIHNEIKMTSNQAYDLEKANIKNILPEEIRKIFIQREIRRADKTATVSLCGNSYTVEGFLAKKKVELRYDAKDLTKIEVFFNGQQYKDAVPLVIKNNVWDGQENNTQNNESQPDKPEGKVKTSYLNLLKEQHDKKLTDKVNKIKYSNLYDGGESSV